MNKLETMCIIEDVKIGNRQKKSFYSIPNDEHLKMGIAEKLKRKLKKVLEGEDNEEEEVSEFYPYEFFVGGNM